MDRAGRIIPSSYTVLPQEDAEETYPAETSSMAASSSQVMPQHEFEMNERKGTRVSVAEVPEKNAAGEAVMEVDDEGPDATSSTRLDQFQMERMGKKQVLVRRFRPMSTFAFNAMATSVWEFGIFSVSQGIVDGGRAGLIWTTIIHAVGFLPIGRPLVDLIPDMC